MSDTKKKETGGFTPEERAAMKERAKELKESASKAEAEKQVLAKIAAMSPADRLIAEAVHRIVTSSGPELAPKLWYGSPAYALNDKVICFFQESSKFKTRYSTLGFSDAANLDDGGMWPVAFAVSKLTDSDEKAIAGLVKRAVKQR